MDCANSDPNVMGSIITGDERWVQHANKSTIVRMVIRGSRGLFNNLVTSQLCVGAWFNRAFGAAFLCTRWPVWSKKTHNYYKLFIKHTRSLHEKVCRSKEGGWGASPVYKGPFARPPLSGHTHSQAAFQNFLQTFSRQFQVLDERYTNALSVFFRYTYMNGASNIWSTPATQIWPVHFRCGPPVQGTHSGHAGRRA